MSETPDRKYRDFYDAVPVEVKKKILTDRLTQLHGVIAHVYAETELVAVQTLPDEAREELARQLHGQLDNAIAALRRTKELLADVTLAEVTP